MRQPPNIYKDLQVKWQSNPASSKVALYSAYAIAVRIRPHIQAPATFFDKWSAFERAISNGACGVVAIERLDGDPVVGQLISLRGKLPHARIVLVTDGSLRHSKSLAMIAVEELICFDEVDEELSAAIVRVAARNPLQTSAGYLAKTPIIPFPLRQVLLRVVTADPPVPSIRRAAIDTGCSVRTLQSQWKRLGKAHESMRLEDLVCSVILIRCLASYAVTEDWGTTVRRIGVRKERVRHIVRRTLDRHLRSLRPAECYPIAQSIGANLNDLLACRTELTQ